MAHDPDENMSVVPKMAEILLIFCYIRILNYQGKRRKETDTPTLNVGILWLNKYPFSIFQQKIWNSVI